MNCARAYLGFVPPERKNGQPRVQVYVRVHEIRTLWLPLFFLCEHPSPLMMRFPLPDFF